MKSPFFSLVHRLAAGSLRVWLMVGILLRLTHLRDRFWPLSLVFYSTPWPVMAAGFVALALHAWRLRREHAVRRYVILTGGALFTWFALSWYAAATEPVAGAPGLKVVEWNIGRPGAWRLARIIPWLRAQDADIIALAETRLADAKIDPAWSQEFPGYQVVPLPREMLCLVRGAIVEVSAEPRLGGDEFSAAGIIRVEIRGIPVTLVQADLIANPVVSRRAPLQRLTELAGNDPNEPVLLLGDWNTPRDSAHLDTLRDHQFGHAFERAGSGFAETWPMFAPALSLDQIWSSPRLSAVRCRIGWTFLSDHRPVVAEFEVKPIVRGEKPARMR